VVASRARGPRLALRAFLIGCAAWVIAVAVAVVVSQANWRANDDLGTQGRFVVGVVTSSTPSDHLYCTYSYSVRGRPYENDSVGCPAGVGFGSPIRVEYLPREPQVAAVGDYIGDTTAPLVGAILFVFVVCTVFSIIVGRLAYWRFTGKWMRSPLRRPPRTTS
jgi:hypothetical protein